MYSYARAYNMSVCSWSCDSCDDLGRALSGDTSDEPGRDFSGDTSDEPARRTKDAAWDMSA